MASQKTKFVVGLFLVCGIGIALLAFIWLGMSRYFEKGRFYVTYFNESVQGLDKDSPVKYRGVSVGRVHSISVAPDSKLVKVVLKIETGMGLDTNMVAQLRSVGITGSVFIELDQKKRDEPDRSPPLSFPSEYPIVASKPSELGEILRGIDDILNKIKAVDLEGISAKVKSNLDTIETAVQEANVKGLSRKVERSLDQLNQILDGQQWDKIMASTQETIRAANEFFVRGNATLTHAENAFAQARGIIADKEQAIREALENINKVIEKSASLTTGADETFSHMRQNLLVSAQNLEKASENLNRFLEVLADQPSQLVFGEPLPRREMDPEF
ncbi:MAG: MCE family protein [Deltaproteobacteria bacterium]|jgi:phospholipid/cholesterol/gamma-HCH transport system substrate-binding protein|nr:MCE family protein [Deltaproteobacteria bacterium]NTV56653.1 MCE family protein [Deltaproteobacteria bacterium]